MIKRYQIELDRNERDFATFLKSRDISLSQNQLRVLIASKADRNHISLFNTEKFIKKLVGDNPFPMTVFPKGQRKNLKT